MIRNYKLFLFLFLLISACSSIPKNTADGCSIFSERYFWFKHVKKTEKKGGTPIYLQLAIIKMESDFDWPYYSKGKFAKDQEYAKMNKLGFWNMKFEYPWIWRKKVRENK